MGASWRFYGTRLGQPSKALVQSAVISAPDNPPVDGRTVAASLPSSAA
jgi:hypothetical protein